MRWLALPLLLIGCVSSTQRAAMRFGETSTAAVAELRLALPLAVAGCHDLALPRRTLQYAKESSVAPPDCTAVTTASDVHTVSLDTIDGFAASMAALGTLDKARADTLGVAATNLGTIAAKPEVAKVGGGIAGAVPRIVAAIGNRAATFQLEQVMGESREPMGVLFDGLEGYFDAAAEQAENQHAAVASVLTTASAQPAMPLAQAAALSASVHEMEARTRAQRRIAADASEVVKRLRAAFASLTDPKPAVDDDERKAFFAATAELVNAVVQLRRALHQETR